MEALQQITSHYEKNILHQLLHDINKIYVVTRNLCTSIQVSASKGGDEKNKNNTAGGSDGATAESKDAPAKK